MSLIKDIVLGLAQPVADVVDELHTSEEEKLGLKHKLFELQVALYDKVLDYEGKLVAAQAQIVTAEAQSESWLSRNWRPLMMVTFMALVVNKWLGLSILLGLPTVYVSGQVENQLWTIIQIGIGGYVGGRTLEKIAPSIASAIGSMKKSD